MESEALSIIEDSPDGFVEFQDIADVLGQEEAMSQVRLLLGLELVECENVMWGLGFDETEFIQGSLIAPRGFFQGTFF